MRTSTIFVNWRKHRSLPWLRSVRSSYTLLVLYSLPSLGAVTLWRNSFSTKRKPKISPAWISSPATLRHSGGLGHAESCRITSYLAQPQRTFRTGLLHQRVESKRDWIIPSKQQAIEKSIFRSAAREALRVLHCNFGRKCEVSRDACI